MIRTVAALLAAVMVSACTPVSDGATELGGSSTITSTLEKYMTAEAREYGFSGAVLVARGHDVLLQRSYGFSDQGRRDRITLDMRFPIASATKPFSATAVALLVERGLIDFDDRICDHLPDCPRSWADVRVANLLDHTSGIPSPGPARIQDSTLRQAIATVKERPLMFEPGSDYTYSNANYWVAGLMIEQVSDLSWSSFLEEEIFSPTSMTNTDAGVPPDLTGFTLNRSADGERSPVSKGFTLRVGHATPQPDPAGGIVSTVDDLYKFVKALDDGGLLSAKTIRRMWTPEGSGKLADYGLGWESFEQNGSRIIQHGGGMPGYTSCVSFYPERDLYVIVLSNLMEVIACEFVGRALGAITLGEPYEMPRRPDGDVNVPRKVLERYAGTYVAGEDRGNERVEIRARNGYLVMRGFTSFPPPFIQTVNLRPFSRTEFFNPHDPHLRIRFGRSDSGRITLLAEFPPYKRFPAMTEKFERLQH